MRLFLYGGNGAAAMALAAAFAAQHGAQCMHRNPKYFEPRDHPERPVPPDFIVTHEGAPNVDAVVEYFTGLGIRGVVLADDVTEDTVREALGPALGVPAVEPSPKDAPLEDLSFNELKARAKEVGVPIVGKRSEIEAAISAKLAEAPPVTE